MVQNIYDEQFPNVWSKWAVLNGLEDLRTFDMHLRSQFQQYRIFFTFEAPGIAFSLAGARLFAFLARSGWSFFGVFFLAGCGAASHLGGGFGGVGVGA